MDFVELEPHRNAIRKVYVSRGHFRSVASGDVLVFYRTGGYYKSVATTIGVVEENHSDVQNEDEFIRLCRKRSVFSDAELKAQWNFRPSNRPFITSFLYAYALPKRPTLKDLIAARVVASVKDAPRGFQLISRQQLETILRLGQADPRIVVD